MELLYILLLIAALICFAISAFIRHRADGQPGTVAGRINFVALGLLFITIMWLVQQIKATTGK